MHISRGSIKLKIENKELTVYGEAMMPKLPPEQSNYVIYTNSIKRFDPPYEEQVIDNVLREKILSFISIELRKSNLNAVIE